MSGLARILLALAASAVGLEGADDAGPGQVPVALKGLDPVALAGGVEVAGDPGLSVVRGPFRYRFSDAEHKALFERSPGRYEIQGGGTCAVMPRVPASPDLFLVHAGRIYGFGSPACLERFRADPATFLAEKPRKKVAILIYDGMEILDFAGPGEVFTVADGGRAFEVFTVAARPGPVTSQGFATLSPRYTIADCPRPDILVVPGGSTQVAAGDPAVIDWVARTSDDAEVVLSVCTGAILLAKAGLLDGLEATTHQSSVGALREAAPGAKVVVGRRFVDNGKVVTSAGVSAGIDASLHLIDRLLGPDSAREAARVMEYRWQPEERAKSD